MVVLASSFHPRWRVTVDGSPVDSQLVAPSFVGASVGAGTHSVVFRYEPYPWSGPLLLLGAVALGAMAGAPLAARRWRPRPQVEGSSEAEGTAPEPRAPAPAGSTHDCGRG